MKYLVIFLVVLALVGVGGFFYLNMNAKTSDSMEVTTESTTQMETALPESSSSSTSMEASEASTPQGSVKEFTIDGSPFKFEPNTITVNKGDTVKINFKNMQGMHDLVIDELNVKSKVLDAGESDTVTFVADKAGTFEYYCSVQNHRQMGMKGTLIVK